MQFQNKSIPKKPQEGCLERENVSGSKRRPAPQQIHRGRPAFADTQRQEVLEMLRTAGPEGVSRATFIFEKHITQCGARVDELKRQGHVLESEWREGEIYVRYFLKSEPRKLMPVAEGVDWYTHETGKPRPAEQPTDLGPLFQTVTHG
jgi:hypothetical protein